MKLNWNFLGWMGGVKQKNLPWGGGGGGGYFLELLIRLNWALNNSALGNRRSYY